MKALFVCIIPFFLGISVYAQAYDPTGVDATEPQYESCAELCKNQEESCSRQSSDINARLDHFMGEATDRLEELVNRIEIVESGKVKDVSEYCDPESQEKLTDIARNYDNVSNIASSFKRKANKLADVVRFTGTLLGEDIWNQVQEQAGSVYKENLPKLNLVTPSEIPVVYIQKKVLTTLIFSTSIELVKASSEYEFSYIDNMLFLNYADSELHEASGNLIVKLKNGDVYPVKLRVADVENRVDLLLEIKSEN